MEGYVEVTDVDLREGEVEEDLQCKGLRILQAPGTYRFSSDSALLANFATCSAGEVGVELCAGSAVVSMRLAAKTPLRRIVAVELQASFAERAARSVKRNGLEARVAVWQGDAVRCAEAFGCGTQDFVAVNPPYFRVGEGEMSEDAAVAMCRHETHITLREVCQTAGKLLRFGGRMYIVYTATRLAELFDEMKRAGIEPKKLVSIQPVSGRQADTVLVEGKRGGKRGMVVVNAVRGDLEAKYTTRE